MRARSRRRPARRKPRRGARGRLRAARGTQLDRAVERQEVGVALVDEQAARAFGGREEDAPGRELREQPLLRRDARHEVDPQAVLAQRVCGAGADRRKPCAGEQTSRRASSRAPFGLVTTTQSYADGSTGSSPSGSIRISGQRTTVVAERLEPRDERRPPAPLHA